MKKEPQKLYIIHGWTYTVTPWARTIALLEKKGLEVEMLHVPGLTASSKKVWTIEEYVRWADRNIPNGAVALGHSNGGRILLNLCSEKPEKLKHLILLDAAGVYEASTKRDFARTLSKKLGFLKKIPGLAKVWHKLTGATDYARAPENMKQTLANMLDSDKNLDISKVTTPTSILWGAEDNVTPPAQAEVMHQQIRGSTLEIFPNWTHAPYLSHPDELARAIYQAYRKPPEVVSEPEVVDDAAAVSAALAMKKATGPKLTNKGPQNPVAPNVATKLVLRKGEKITDGLKVSDAEGAAVKYQAKINAVPTKKTNASAESASLALKKSKPEGGVIAELDSQSAETVDFVPLAGDTLGKIESKKSSVSSKPISKAGAKPAARRKLSAAKPTAAQKLPTGTITSASVPKVGRLERAKRKVKAAKTRNVGAPKKGQA